MTRLHRLASPVCAAGLAALLLGMLGCDNGATTASVPGPDATVQLSATVSANGAATGSATPSSATPSSATPSSATPSSATSGRASAMATAAPRSRTAIAASSADLPKPPEDHQPGKGAVTTTTAAKVHFSSASDALALTANQRGVLVTLSGKPTITKLSPDTAVVDVAISASGKKLAMWAADGSIEIVGADGAAIKKLPRSPVPTDGFYTQLRWSGDDGWLAGSDGSKVHVWNVTEGKLRHSFEAQAFSLGFGYDGHRLAAATASQVWVWDAHTGSLLDERYTRTGGTFATVVSPDANWVAAAEQDGHGATLYETRPWQLKSVLVGDTTCDAHIGVRFSHDNRTAFAHGGAKWIRAFSTKTAAPVASWTAPDGIVDAEMADSGKLVVGYNGNGDALLFDLSQNKQTHTVKGVLEGSWALSPNGRFLVAYRPDMARIWSTADGAQLLEVKLDD